MTAIISVGVSDYRVASAVAPSFESLDFAVSDATHFHNIMTAHTRISRATLLTSDAAGDAEATRINLLRSLEELSASPARNSIIYFSGHGLDINGALHLCPEDFDPRVPEFSSVAVSQLVNRLARQRGWSLIIIDACRNRIAGARRRVAGYGDRGGVVFVADNVCVLLACSNDEQALETPTIGGAPAGGIFTHFLCDHIVTSLRSKRRLSVGDLFAHSQTRTAEFAASILERQQTPRSVGMHPHDVFLDFSSARRRSIPQVRHPLAFGQLGGPVLLAGDGPIKRAF